MSSNPAPRKRQRRRKHGTGCLVKDRRTGRWFMRYYDTDGVQRTRATGTTDRVKAEHMLRDMLAAKERGENPTPARTLRFTDLVALGEAAWKGRALRSRPRLTYLKSVFGKRRVSTITWDAIEDFKQKRRTPLCCGGIGDERRTVPTCPRPATPVTVCPKCGARGATRASVNRELATLRRLFRLAVKAKKLTRDQVPAIELFKEDNIREGFFEVDQLDRLLALLPEDVRPAVEFAAYTGWRQGEVFGLTWDDVDFGEGECRTGMTKNGEPRTFPFAIVPRLEALLREQRARTTALERELSHDAERPVEIPWVFHRRGAQLKGCRRSWLTAVKSLDVWFRQYDPDLQRYRKFRPRFHDLRHTAAQNLYRAGVDKTAIMALCGWETEAMFRRYRMEDDRAKRDAVAKLVAHMEAERAAAAAKAKARADVLQLVPRQRRTG